ncbi:MAG: GlsB/YeaQ/YmgE family stress response membrane protein [Candidatus Aminicenantes bacterium]|nr:MAG: GlsB/YeaQ/YmgE family stress response membrane protein [Candidatus Aminicenantes bacterium]
MDITSLIIFLAIGALTGWLAGNIMIGRGFGAIGNILVGIVGAVLGGFVFSLLGLTAGGLIGSIITAATSFLFAVTSFFIEPISL